MTCFHSTRFSRGIVFEGDLKTGRCQIGRREAYFMLPLGNLIRESRRFHIENPSEPRAPRDVDERLGR